MEDTNYPPYEKGSIVEYTILVAHDYDILINQVQEKLRLNIGWQPLDGVKIADEGVWRKYLQTMVRIAQ